MRRDIFLVANLILSPVSRSLFSGAVMDTTSNPIIENMVVIIAVPMAAK